MNKYKITLVSGKSIEMSTGASLDIIYKKIKKSGMLYIIGVKIFMSHSIESIGIIK